MYLYHYYDKELGPYKNLSDLAIDEANKILNNIKELKPNSQSAQRDSEYIFRRRMYEDIIRKEFLKKGGIVDRTVPHYMVIEHSPWLSTWFNNSAYIKIAIQEFDLKKISFTYGDSHPTYSPWPRDDDWKEYRRQLYSYEEILLLIKKYGLPQEWNGDGRHGPERYIEAQIWSDETINRYR